MIEQKCIVNGIEITFMQQHKKHDTKHLVVIMSGFGAGEMHYDFPNALVNCPSEIIWIKDCFDDHCSYYLCRNMNFDVEQAVIDFIDLKLSELRLDRDHCTVAGFSKGGSAALYFGIKYNFKSTISVVPQFYIGSYVNQKWAAPAKNMMGEITEEKIKHLDSVIPEMLKNDTNLDKNIYLITSTGDYQYEQEILPNIQYLEKYSNFNLLVSNSLLISEHVHVTPNNIPLILSLFYSLSAGAIPTFGKRVELISDHSRNLGTLEKVHVLVPNAAVIDGSTMFIDGISVIQGLECPDWQDINHILLLEANDGRVVELQLAKAHNPLISKQLYKDYYVNYDKGWFTTLQNKGVNLSDVPSGVYKLSLNTSCHGETRTSAVKITKSTRVQSNSKEFQFSDKDGNLRLTIRRKR